MKLKLFTSQDLEKIKQAIDAAEVKTDGEIVCKILRSSSGYSSAWYSLILMGEILGGMTYFFWSYLSWSPAELIPFIESLIGGAVFCLALGAFTPLRRWIVGEARRNRATQERALLSFSSLGMRNTKRATGVLLFISEWERKVVILADAAIQAKVHPNGGDSYWEKEVAQIAAGLKSGNGTSAVCQAISSLGLRLSEHFPALPKNPNELANEVRLET